MEEEAKEIEGMTDQKNLFVLNLSKIKLISRLGSRKIVKK